MGIGSFDDFSDRIRTIQSTKQAIEANNSDKNKQKPTDYETVKEAFKKDVLLTYYLLPIEAYIKMKKMDFNVMNAKSVYDKLNFNVISKDIMPVVRLFDPRDEKTLKETRVELRNRNFKVIDSEIAILDYMRRVIPDTYESILNASNKKLSIEETLKKSNVPAENIIAIKKLVDELEQNYSRLVGLDVNFLNTIVNNRPLIALVMLTKPTLNKILIDNYYNKLFEYIENGSVYEQIHPFIKIHDGKTHGQWRHLSDPSKTCIVLTMKNCKIASSKNTQKSYDKSETEGKFLVLQGLSIQADSDNAEVHYLEV